MTKNAEMKRIMIFMLWVGWFQAEAVLTCNKPSLVEGLIVPQKDVYENGLTAYRICGNFKDLKASVKPIRCQDGVWSPNPECKENCLTPQVENALEVNQLYRSYKTGDRVQFKCNKDLEFSDVDYAECVAGQWVLPVCKSISQTCSSPSPVKNAVIQTQFQSFYEKGAQIEYRCKDGNELIGNNLRTCLGRQWSTAPTCGEQKESATVYIFHGGRKGMSKVHIFHVSQCGTHPEVADGVVSEDPNGMALTVQCFRFYKREGFEKIYCNQNRWTEQPVCKPPCQLDPSITLFSYKERYLEDGRTLSNEWCTNRRDFVNVKCIDGILFYKGCGRQDF